MDFYAVTFSFVEEIEFLKQRFLEKNSSASNCLSKRTWKVKSTLVMLVGWKEVDEKKRAERASLWDQKGGKCMLVWCERTRNCVCSGTENDIKWNRETNYRSNNVHLVPQYTLV